MGAVTMPDFPFYFNCQGAQELQSVEGRLKAQNRKLTGPGWSWKAL